MTYLFSERLSYPISSFTTTSSFVLYENGRFTLRYHSSGNEYPGTHRQEIGGIVFRFASDGGWGAVGTLVGDALEVRYNVRTQLSDFEDAVYRRSP